MRLQNRALLENEISAAPRIELFDTLGDKAMRSVLTAAAVLVLCGAFGCTSTTLQHYTLNQAMMVSDLRYRQILQDLAVIANNAGNLPSFALTANGTANMTHTISIDTATLWAQAVNGFSQETLTGFGQLNPELQWTLDPVVSEPQLQAIKYACLWAIIGPPPPGSPEMELLRSLTIQDVAGCPECKGTRSYPGYHFGVAKQLSELSNDWLHVTKKKNIGNDAIYHATCGDTAVWVTEDGMDELSEFLLVILDIASIDPKSLSVQVPTASVVITEKNDAGNKMNDNALMHDFRLSSKERMDCYGPAGTANTGVNCSEPSDVDARTQMKEANKVTETWNVCQDLQNGLSGPITLSRPTAIAQKIFETPRIRTDTVPLNPSGPTPLRGAFVPPVTPLYPQQ
jgi:hypothetical protein